VTIDSRRGDQHAIRVDRRADSIPASLACYPSPCKTHAKRPKGVGSILRPAAVETLARMRW